MSSRHVTIDCIALCMVCNNAAQATQVIMCAVMVQTIAWHGAAMNCAQTLNSARATSSNRTAKQQDMITSFVNISRHDQDDAEALQARAHITTLVQHTTRHGADIGISCPLLHCNNDVNEVQANTRERLAHYHAYAHERCCERIASTAARSHVRSG